MKPKQVILIILCIVCTISQAQVCTNKDFVKKYNLSKANYDKQDYREAIKNINSAFEICPRCSDCETFRMICLKANYQQIGKYYNGLAAVQKDGQFGFIDASGQEVVAPQYDMVWAFNEGLAVVKKNDKFGVVG